jgi:hypothetical protein
MTVTTVCPGISTFVHTSFNFQPESILHDHYEIIADSYWIKNSVRTSSTQVSVGKLTPDRHTDCRRSYIFSGEELIFLKTTMSILNFQASFKQRHKSEVLMLSAHNYL